jgi:hypothetical protein
MLKGMAHRLVELEQTCRDLRDRLPASD